MTDLITRARKEWCEPFTPRSTLSTPIWYPCPQSVVAALLDVLRDYRDTCDSQECVRPCCQTPSYMPHRPKCVLVLSEAAITRALEQKP